MFHKRKIGKKNKIKPNENEYSKFTPLSIIVFLVFQLMRNNFFTSL